MKFEEVLPSLRLGKKIRCASYDREGQHWIAGYIGFIDIYDDDGKLIQSPERTLTIHRLNAEGLSIDGNPHGWGMCRWAILDETWEIVE